MKLVLIVVIIFSWAPTEGGWIGNGDSFVFSIKPKMAVFYATGKNENFLYLDRNSGLGLGGKPGRIIYTGLRLP